MIDEKRPRARIVWPRVLSYLGASFVIGAAAQYVGLLLFLWLRDGPGSLDTRIKIASASGDGDALLGAAAFAAPILLGFTWCVRRFLDGRTLASLGFRRADALNHFRTGLSCGLLLPGVILFLGSLAGVYRFEEFPGLPLLGFSRLGVGPSTLLCLLLFVIGFTLQAGAEELLVRGYVQTKLHEWQPSGARRTFWVLIVPSILFALAHVSNSSITLLALINTALAGVVLAMLVLRTGSLWAAIGGHAGWNLGMAVLWSLPVSGVTTSHMLAVERIPSTGLREWLFGGDYGPEGGLITTLLYALALWLVARIPETPRTTPELDAPTVTHEASI